MGGKDWDDRIVDHVAAKFMSQFGRDPRGNPVALAALTAAADGIPTDCVVTFDNLHTLPRQAFRRRVATLPEGRMAQACRVMRDAFDC